MRNDARRQAILQAAKKVALEVGVGRVTMGLVAKAAGINVSGIYRYYSSKDELLSAALQRPVSSKDDMAESRRDEIMDAALHLFAHQGYHATTMAQIGEALHITQGAIYRWFKSKEEILDGILHERLSPLPVLEQNGKEVANGRLEEDLHRLGYALVHAFHKNKDVWRFIFSEGMYNKAAAGLIYQKLFLDNARRLAQHMDRYHERLQAADSQLGARFFLGGLVMYLVIRHLFGEDFPDTFLNSDLQLVDRMTDVLLHGLLKPT